MIWTATAWKLAEIRSGCRSTLRLLFPHRIPLRLQLHGWWRLLRLVHHQEVVPVMKLRGLSSSRSLPTRDFPSSGWSVGLGGQPLVLLVKGTWQDGASQRCLIAWQDGAGQGCLIARRLGCAFLHVDRALPSFIASCGPSAPEVRDEAWHGSVIDWLVCSSTSLLDYGLVELLLIDTFINTAFSDPIGLHGLQGWVTACVGSVVLGNNLEVIVVTLGREWPISDVCPSHSEKHARWMVIKQAHSIDHIRVILHLTISEIIGAVARWVKTLHAGLEHHGLLDQWVGSLAAIYPIGQVAKIILLSFILGDAALIRHFTPHFYQFSTQREILIIYLSILKFVLRYGEAARLVFSQVRWFFLKSDVIKLVKSE